MKIIDGKAIAQELRAELKEKISRQEKKPGLAVVIVGEDPASRIYVRNKIKACGEIGIRSYAFELPENSTQEELESLLDSLTAPETFGFGVGYSAYSRVEGRRRFFR